MVRLPGWADGRAETLYWTVLIVPAIALFTNLSLGDIIVQTFNPCPDV
jgi:hypothetical protein